MTKPAESKVQPFFASVPDVKERLKRTGYLASEAVATAVFLADQLGKPLLVEGPAGVGKTELAKAVASSGAARFVRLQCYEGVDESRVLYEWNYAMQILRVQTGKADSSSAGDSSSWAAMKNDIFTEEFLLERPLLTAIRQTGPTALLIDEIDKADVEVEGLLLEVLSDFAITIPELGPIESVRRPFTLLTSNASRELSEALKRRCLFLHIDFPDPHLEREILAERVPQLRPAMAEQLVRVVGVLRGLSLKKPPSVAESIDWARTLLALGQGDAAKLSDKAIEATLGAVLKHRGDHDLVRQELKL